MKRLPKNVCDGLASIKSEIVKLSSWLGMIEQYVEDAIEKYCGQGCSEKPKNKK